MATTKAYIQLIHEGSTLVDYDLVLRNADQNEALIRTRINPILLTILATRIKRGSTNAPKDSQLYPSYKILYHQLEQSVSNRRTQNEGASRNLSSFEALAGQ